MPELEAARTLVKSPPELWAELSDPAALARHLGEFGEIRITRVVPEQTVAWEGERASGTVSLEASGWGTRVTLRALLPEPAAPVERPQAPDPAPPASGPERVDGSEMTAWFSASDGERVQEQSAGEEVVAIADPAVVATADPAAVATADPAPGATAPVKRPGFFARLFKRRSSPAAVAEPAAIEPASIEPAGIEPDTDEPEATAPAAIEPAVVEPETPPPAPVAEDPAEPETPEPAAAPAAAEPETPEPAAAPAAAEPETPEPETPEPAAAQPATPATPEPELLDATRAEAVLTTVLDDLGSAHHRPFSRS